MSSVLGHPVDKMFPLQEFAHLSCGTRVSLNRGVEHELSPILGPVQNQILLSRGPSCVGTLRNSVSIAQAYQENLLDIGLDTLPVFVLVCR